MHRRADQADGDAGATQHRSDRPPLRLPDLVSAGNHSVRSDRSRQIPAIPDQHGTGQSHRPGIRGFGAVAGRENLADRERAIHGRHGLLHLQARPCRLCHARRAVQCRQAWRGCASDHRFRRIHPSQPQRIESAADLFRGRRLPARCGGQSDRPQGARADRHRQRPVEGVRENEPALARQADRGRRLGAGTRRADDRRPQYFGRLLRHHRGRRARSERLSGHGADDPALGSR